MLPTQELLKKSEELRKLLDQAKNLAAHMQASVPELDEPALRAQCSVIRAFIFQIERQEKLLNEMLKARHQVVPERQLAERVRSS